MPQHRFFHLAVVVHTGQPDVRQHSASTLVPPDCREECIVATKVAGPSAKMEWIRGGPTSLNAQNIQEAVDSSLMRLQTDYIDIFQLHWPDRYTIPVACSSLPTAQDIALM